MAFTAVDHIKASLADGDKGKTAFLQINEMLSELYSGVAANTAAIAAASKHLATLTASASATLDDTTSITSAYDLYMIELINLLPATDAVGLKMRVTVDGGSSWAAANYLSTLTGGYIAGFDGTGHASETATDGVQLAGVGTGFNGVSNSANYGVNGTIFLHSPANMAGRKAITGHTTWQKATPGRMNTATVGGIYDGANSAVNGVRFLMSSGNIASGRVRISGIRTS